MDAQLLLGRYRRVRNIGQGGFSTVDLFEDTRLKREIAIKRIPTRLVGQTDDTPGLKEAQAAAHLNNPHIVKILDFRLLDNEALLLMEYVDGPTLTKLLLNSKVLLDLDCIAALARDVGQALGYAHENAILHLDIKPDNVLVAAADGHAKVSDFGLSQIFEATGFANPGGGSVGYMPPEQIRLEEVDARSDIWAFAILVYQLLTGVNPYLTSDPRRSLELIEAKPLTPPSQLCADLEGELDDVLLWALAPAIDERPDSIADFLDQLLPLLGSVRSGHGRLKPMAVECQARAAADQAPSLAAAVPRAPAAPQPASATAPTAPLAPFAPLLPASANQQRGFGVPDPEIEKELDLQGLLLDDPAGQPAPAQRQNIGNAKGDKKNKAARAPGAAQNTGFWGRLGRGQRSMIARAAMLFAALTLTYIGLSGFGLGGLSTSGLAAGMTASAQNSLVIGVLVLVAIVAFIAPPAGSAIGLLAFAAGLVACGLVYIGLGFFLLTWVFWALIGRRGLRESWLLAATPFFALLLAPFTVPVLAGSLLKPWPALAASAFAWVTLVLLAGLGTPLLGFSLSPLYCGAFVVPAASEAFPQTLRQIVFDPAAWFGLGGFLLATTVGLLINRQKTRKRLLLSAVLATIVLAAFILIVPLWFGSPVLSGLGSDYYASLGHGAPIGTLLRLFCSFAVLFLLAGLGVGSNHPNDLVGAQYPPEEV
ncbi:MAG: serine/threonine protein kinase [Coriobacteriia bacterium]|nr:serine/threonine protein kinase [Coriobacteriia bacterium]